MRVLAVDPGTAIVGYSVVEFEKGKYNILDYGCIYTEKTEEMPVRLNKIYDGLDAIIKLYKPESAAVEELFFFKNNKTIITVGQARGVIILCLERNGIKSHGYTPLQVKQGIAAYGRATKQQVQEMVKRILGLDEIPKPDDAADALALAVTHINSMKSIVNKTSSYVTGVETANKKIPAKKISNIMTAEEYRKLISGK